MRRRLIRTGAFALLALLTLLTVGVASANTGEWNSSTYLTIAKGKTWTKSRTVTVKLCGYNNHPAVSPAVVYLEQYAIANSEAGLTSFRSYGSGAQVSVPGLAFSRTWKLSAGDGVKQVFAIFTGRGEGVEIDEPVSPSVVDEITLDTHGPRCSAPRKASVIKNRNVTLRYRVRDNLAPKATVTIKIRNTSGKVVKTLRLGKRATGKLLGKRFRCRLAPGTYRFSVYAKDLAGNKQARVGSNRLTVKTPPKPQPVVRVGITETGECYHRLTCYHFTKHPSGNSVVSLAAAKSMGYRPCKVCKPPQ